MQEQKRTRYVSLKGSIDVARVALHLHICEVIEGSDQIHSSLQPQKTLVSHQKLLHSFQDFSILDLKVDVYYFDTQTIDDDFRGRN